MNEADATVMMTGEFVLPDYACAMPDWDTATRSERAEWTQAQIARNKSVNREADRKASRMNEALQAFGVALKTHTETMQVG